jgi:cytochrome b
MIPMVTTMNANNEIKVWDPLVRVFHWSLVAAFTIAYLSGEEWEVLHVWAGYIVAGLVAIRLLWGIIGTEHARFRDFAYNPVSVITYLKDLVALRARRYIGHSPAGGAMVIVLLLSLAATTLSGMQLYAVEENKGPFADVRFENISPIAIAYADEDEDGHEQEGHDEFWEETHEFFANFSVLLVFLHLGGVALASFVHGENLPRAMVTGRKRRE